MTPATLTAHAINRYRQRWRPNWTTAAAREELLTALPKATFVETADGDAIYRTQRGALLVVAADGTVRTVLPRGATKPDRRPRR